MPTTPRGYPYPTPADPVALGANDIRALAEKIDLSGLQQIQNLTVSSPAVLQFDAIPQTYAHLLLVAFLRASDAVTFTTAALRFSGDAAASYTYARMGIDNNAAQNDFSAAASQIMGPVMPGGSAAAGNFGAMFALIPSYAKADAMAPILTGGFGAVGTQVLRFTGGLWTPLGAVTAVQLFSTSASTWASGSRATLYGLG